MWDFLHGTTVLDWLTMAAALSVGLMRVGEWKRAREAGAGAFGPGTTGALALQLLREELRREIATAAQAAAKESSRDCEEALARLEDRLARAGEKSSELATRVQGMPTH